MTINLKIVSPDGIIFENHNVNSVQITTDSGIITVYHDHEPMISKIVPGEILIEMNEEKIEMAVSSGIIMIENESQIKLLVDTAERSEEINIERAEEAKQNAEKLLTQSEYIEDVEVAKLQAKIQKELARIQVASRYRRVRG